MLIIIIVSIIVYVFWKRKRKQDIVCDALSLLAQNNKSIFKCKDCKYFYLEGSHNGIFGTCVKFSDKPNKKGTDLCPYSVLEINKYEC